MGVVDASRVLAKWCIVAGQHHCSDSQSLSSLCIVLRRARVEIASRARGGCKCRVGVKFATSCADHRHFTDQATRLPDFIQRYGSGGRRSCWHRRPAGPEGLDDLGPRVWGGARTKTALRLQRSAPKSGEDMEVRLFESRYFPPRLGAVRHVGWWIKF